MTEHAGAVVCEVRYRLDPERLDDFEEYGRAWMRLIERWGGVHHGFFVPGTPPADTTISFPDRGKAGRGDEAVALFEFPDEDAYRRYRTEIPLDPEGAAVIERFADPPFENYERLFLRPLAGRVRTDVR